MNQDIHNQEQHGENHDHIITFFVNGEDCNTLENKLTVRQILEMSGFTLAEQFRLTRDDGNKTFTDMNQEVSIHKGESFTATYAGTTPVS